MYVMRVCMLDTCYVPLHMSTYACIHDLDIKFEEFDQKDIILRLVS